MRLRELYRQWRDRDHLWRGHDLTTKATFIAGKIQRFVPLGARHLDIACGDGQILHAFDRLGCKSVGIELSERRLARCKNRDCTVVRADMTADLPFKNAAFNVITLISTIEHALYPDLLLKETDRVLSKDGLIVIQIPNPYFPIDLHNFLPFYGYFPPSIQRMYLRRFAGKKYEIKYYTAHISKRDLARLLTGYAPIHAQNIVYPIEVAPDWLKPYYSIYEKFGLSRLFPTGYLFVYRKTQAGSHSARLSIQESPGEHGANHAFSQ